IAIINSTMHSACSLTDNIPTLYIIRTDNSDCFILKINETNNWQIDRIIVTNPHKNHLDSIIRFFKECFSLEGIHTKGFPNLDFHVILTKKFKNKHIINILRDNGFEFENKESKFEYPNITIKCFFHENGMPLILRHRKNAEQNFNTVGNRDNNVTMMRNNEKIQTNMSSILTYLQYTNNGIKKSIFLTNDNITSWIQTILTTKLNVYQQSRLNERPFIDIFQVPSNGSRFNSIISHYVNPPKYVHQQFAIMVILYYGGQFNFKDLNNKTAIDIKFDFEILLNSTNFETFKKAALLQGYNQTLSNQNVVKHFLKSMAKALTIQRSSKNNNVDWDWDKINWPEVARKLYIIYKINQTTKLCGWPKYDFIKDVVDIPKKDNIDSYFNHTIRGDIIEEQLYSYFNRTYIISSGLKHDHPDLLVIIGIIKSILEDSKEERNARILLSSGSKINMNLLSLAVNDLLEYKSYDIDIHKLLNQYIKVYITNDRSYKVGIMLSNGKFESPKSVRHLNWNRSEEVAIKKIFDTFKTIPEQPINKSSEFYIKILIENKKLWLGVNEKGDLVPSDKPFLFMISNWIAKDEYKKFYLVDLNMEQDLYYALEYDDDDFCIVEKSEMGDFEELTTTLHFKNQHTKVDALLFNLEKDSRDGLTNQSIERKKSGKTLLSFLTELGEPCNVKKLFESFPDECLLFLLAKLDSEVEWEITKNNLFNIKNTIIRLDELELPKLRSSSAFYKHAMDMQWKDLTFSYLSLLIMPLLIVAPEFLKVPLPFLTGTSILNQKINKEISNIKFEIGPTGARLIQTELFLDISTTDNIFQLDGIKISQLTDIKITIINSDAINDNPNIIIEAFANIKDNAVKIITQNENDQFLIAKFNKSTTFTNIAKSLNIDETVYNKFKVPLYDIFLDDFLKNINPEFSLFFYPITKPPTMNFKLKNISILTNNSHQIEKFVPPQIYQHLKLMNISTDISIYDPLDIKNIVIEQPMSIYIKPQDLYDDNNNHPLNLKEMLKAISLYDTFKKINEVSPILWHHVKNLESVEFQYLDLQIKFNEQSTIYEIDDFNLCILIPRFIIKEGVIEIISANVDLEYNGTQWSGNIWGVAEIIGKDKNYNCQIEYMSPTKEQFGNLLIKDFIECLTLKEICQIL
ncbi:12293_t:CDS:2, partial [Gigaspora margarita]